MYLCLHIPAGEFDPSEFGPNDIVRDYSSDIDAYIVYSPVTEVVIGTPITITFADGDTITDPSWAYWSVVAEVPAE